MREHDYGEQMPFFGRGCDVNGAGGWGENSLGEPQPAVEEVQNLPYFQTDFR